MAAKKSGAKVARKATSKKVVAKKSAAKTTPSKKPSAPKGATKVLKSAVKRAPQSMPYEQGKWAHVYTRAPGERRYWLLKSEPDVFSFADLQAAPQYTTSWDSVRNTGARNFMRDAMKKGDLAFYYHSNSEPSAIVGICEVVREGYPDDTAFDPHHPYFDAESVRETPTWFMVDVKAVRTLERAVTLPEIKEHPVLRESALIKVGRLSVVPITAAEWEAVLTASRA